jgi:putative membrane protein
MLAPRRDDVSNIHRRWSATRINPSSSRVSYAIWIGCAIIIVVTSHIYNFQTGIAGLALYVPISLAFLVGSHFLDYIALRGTAVRKFSKIAHVSAFANILWSLTLLLGIAADFLFSKSPSMDYVIAGMLLAVGFRMGLFISVFGASTSRAILVSFIQPVIFFFAFLPPSLYISIMTQSYMGIAFGAILLAIGIVWTVIADRAGRPGVKSTFGLLRAFLVAWSENRVDMIEELIEAKAHENLITTKVIRLFFAGNQAAIVLPEVHPGPFSMVGGSNLPYVLYEKFSKRALVMHSISDHSLNIPSKKEVEKYINDLGQMITKEKGSMCSTPVQVRVNNSTSTGIAFGNTAMVLLSLAPNGMEDIPRAVSTELESFGAAIGFSDILVVDCHNAMGEHLNDSDRKDLIASAKQCLDQLKKQPQKRFKVGFASLDGVDYRMDRTDELGQGGLAVLVLSIDHKNYVIGWADSNNMKNTVRDYIVSKINNSSIGTTTTTATTMLEICSSDTHSTSGKRTREGYFALGTTTNLDKISAAYSHLCSKASDMAAESSFELAYAQSAIKVMGKKQFEDYSSALDRSVNVTKIFIAITIASFIAMLVLS